MNSYIRSLKLAAAVGLLVASAALAAPPEQPVGKNNPEQPTVRVLPSGDRVIELREGTLELEDGTALPSGHTVERDGIVNSPGNPMEVKPTGVIADMGHPSTLMLGRYWIGVGCRRLPPVLYDHIEIPKGQGLVVVEVVPGGPAEKAGIAPNDILLSADGKPLGDQLDVIRATHKAQTKSISFELLRKGQRKTIEVAPEENPHWKPKTDQPQGQPPAGTASPQAAPPYDELEQIYQWFERNHPGQTVRPQMRLRFMRPGVILPPDAPMHPALPGGTSVTIMKRGNEPTQITVTRDKDVWKVDENSLDRLPEDLRPMVERMLRGLVIAPDVTSPRVDFMPDWMTPKAVPPGTPEDVQVLRERIENRIEERMNQMNERLRRMQEAIETLRHDQPPRETQEPAETPGPEEK
ncbi:MAG TPA: PDZ domain-containing protein [Thermoguttaceae bacterium]|nr:PDZ domain-containing protein [Thermoguttaceae bacterium]